MEIALLLLRLVVGALFVGHGTETSTCGGLAFRVAGYTLAVPAQSAPTQKAANS